jgi:SAM-dependent methyltransferase
LTCPASTPPQLRDYKQHYRVDADFIEDPSALSHVRSASERRRLQVIVDRLQLRPGMFMLDLGCGSGWLADISAGHGARILACDLAPSGVAAARRRFPQAADYVASDVYAVGLAAASCDVIVLSEVVEHLEDVVAGLSEAARLLKPGGRLIVTVPYRETILQHLCIHCNQPTPANAHLHSFDETSLGHALLEAGLRPTVSCVMGNKALELMRFPQWTRWWPQWLWRLTDGLCNRLTGKAAFLLMVSERA